MTEGIPVVRDHSDNPLSNIIIEPGFIPADECQEIVAKLSGRVPEDLGTGEYDAISRQRALDASFVDVDVADAGALMAKLRERGPASSLLAPFLVRHATTLSAIQKFPDLPVALVDEFVAAMQGLLNDAQLYAKNRGMFDGARSESTFALLAYLQARKVIGADGAPLSPPNDISPRTVTVALRWLNATLLEDILRGVFLKTSRLYPRDYDVRGRAVFNPVVIRAFDRAAEAVPSLRPIWDRARDGDYLDLLELCLIVFEDPRAARTALEALGVAARDDDESNYGLLHVALGNADPSLFVPPKLATSSNNRGRAIVSSFRNVQTVEWADVRPRITYHTDRFMNAALPRYGLTGRNVEETQLLRTTVQGFLRPHNDSEKRRHNPDGTLDWVKGRKRDVSLVLYLSRSTDYEGGALWFTNLSLDLRPEQGMAIAFPADHRYDHCVREVTRGTRWAVSAWIDCDDCAPIGTVNQEFHWGYQGSSKKESR